MGGRVRFHFSLDFSFLHVLSELLESGQLRPCPRCPPAPGSLSTRRRSWGSGPWLVRAPEPGFGSVAGEAGSRQSVSLANLLLSFKSWGFVPSLRQMRAG